MTNKNRIPTYCI